MYHSPTTRPKHRALLTATALSVTAGLVVAAAPAFAAMSAPTVTVTTRTASAHALASQPHRYELINTASQLRADVIGASTASTTGVFLWPDNTSASQEFRKLESPGGFFRLQAVHSGQCLILDWRGGKYSNGTPIVQHPDCRSGYAPAEWKLRPVPKPPCTKGPPYFCGFQVTQNVLVNRRTGRCLDAGNAAGGRPPARAVLQQWDCVKRDDAWNMGNQAWVFNDLDAPPPIVR